MIPTTDDALQHARELLASLVVDFTIPEANRVDAIVPVENLVEAVRVLVDARWGYLSAVTGLDLGVEQNQFEVLYHFCSGAAVLTSRVKIPRDRPLIPSICGLIPSSSIFERELREMFGIVVTDTPDIRLIFLPDDWEEGVYPLRKDVTL
jgi:Ni,Fe-hydrogenase III component G